MKLDQAAALETISEPEYEERLDGLRHETLVQLPSGRNSSKKLIQELLEQAAKRRTEKDRMSG